MRNELISLIKKNFKTNNKIFFLTADLGYSVLEPLQNISKKRFINVGVSENNMMLMAVGISSHKNYLTYVYSISPFITLRTLEIIRNYLSNEKRNIRILGIGSGVSYDKLGKTHFNLDDINVIYSLKNIIILNPANTEELNYLYKKFIKYNGPLYFRINKTTFSQKLKFKKNKNLFIKKGKKGNLIVSGAILNYVIKLLNKDEINELNIVSVPILNNYFNKNLKSNLVKGKILSICDSSKTIFFEELKNNIILRNDQHFHNFDFDHNKIKFVGNQIEILTQMGLTRKNLIKHLF